MKSSCPSSAHWLERSLYTVCIRKACSLIWFWIVNALSLCSSKFRFISFMDCAQFMALKLFFQYNPGLFAALLYLFWADFRCPAKTFASKGIVGIFCQDQGLSRARQPILLPIIYSWFSLAAREFKFKSNGHDIVINETERNDGGVLLVSCHWWFVCCEGAAQAKRLQKVVKHDFISSDLQH